MVGQQPAVNSVLGKYLAGMTRTTGTLYVVCESTAAEAVDDMQRMNVADRKKAANG